MPKTVKLERSVEPRLLAENPGELFGMKVNWRTSEQQRMASKTEKLVNPVSFQAAAPHQDGG